MLHNISIDIVVLIFLLSFPECIFPFVMIGHEPIPLRYILWNYYDLQDNLRNVKNGSDFKLLEKKLEEVIQKKKLLQSFIK